MTGSFYARTNVCCLDKEYYATHYEDGVYYAEAPVRSNSSNTIVAGGEKTIKALQRAPSVATKRAGSLMRSQSKRSYVPPPRCSETYNASLQR